MSVRNQFKLLLGGLSARRRGRTPSTRSATREFFDRSRFVAGLIFVATVAAIVLISTVGLTTLNVPVLPNQLATSRVVAATPFTFASLEQTKAAGAQLVNRLPPVYRIDLEPFRRFDAAARDLLSQLERFEREHPANALVLNDPRSQLSSIVEAFNARGPYHASVEDITAVLAAGDAKARAALFENGLAALRDIANEGVHDDHLGGSNPGDVTVFQLVRPTGEVALRPVQSLEEAMTFLRVNLSVEGLARPSAMALFRFFRTGLTANLAFDRAATEQSEAAARS
ncbi:MAG: phosphohydrolase, partial [Opitutaceae bacterium]